jgi:hypothetical protein
MLPKGSVLKPGTILKMSGKGKAALAVSSPMAYHGPFFSFWGYSALLRHFMDDPIIRSVPL